MDFSQALDELKDGHELQRKGWNGANQRVHMFIAGATYQPCFILHNAQGLKQPGWLPSMGDLLADDWQIYKPVAENGNIGNGNSGEQTARVHAGSQSADA